MLKQYISKSASQTKKIGKEMAEDFFQKSKLVKNRKKALVLGLKGDLGGGKTTFLQGFAKGLGIKEKITSPTFLIMKKYRVKKIEEGKPGIKYFFHIDCYRLKRAREIFALGFQDIVKNPNNVIAIEWADLLKKVLPFEIFWVEMKFINKNTRVIIINNNF